MAGDVGEGSLAAVVVDALTEGVAVVDRSDGTILYTNPAWDELFGYERGELVGLPIAVVNAPGERSPEETARTILDQLDADGSWRGEIRNRRKDGSELWTAAYATAHDHPELGRVWIGVQVDITEQHEARRSVRAATGMARLGMWRLDTVANELHWSPEMFDIYGLDPATFRPAPGAAVDFAHPDDLHTVAELYSSALAGTMPEAADFRIRRPDGEERHLQIRAHPVDERGEMHGIVLDVTAGKVAEASLRDLNTHKDTFLQAVSHDLRNPLVVIEGFASIIERQAATVPAAELAGYAHRIIDAAQRMRRQLNDLLDLDRLGRGVIEPNRDPVDVRLLAVDAVAAIGVADRVVIEGEAFVVAVDGAQVERVVENLVANAVRHTPPGTPITVRLEPAEGGVLVCVDDEGPGIAEDMREEVFDVFRTASSGTAGTGVGLSLVRRFAELHGGRAWVEERPGGGAAFRALFPGPAR